MKYTAAIAATLAVASAVSTEPQCKIVTSVTYGQPTWVPDHVAGTTWATWDPVKTPVPTSKKTSSSEWNEWDPKTPVPTSKKTSSSEWNEWDPKTPVPTSKKTTSTEAWGAWETTSSKKSADPTSKKTTEAGWESWTSSYTTTKSASAAWSTTKGGEFYPVTTTKGEYEGPATTTTTTAAATTTAASRPAPTCGAGKSTELGVGAGSCTYDLYCHQSVSQATIADLFKTGSINFFEKDTTQHNSVAECQAICDTYDSCDAVIFVDDPSASSSDYKQCWMVTGLPAVSGDGIGQISYKKSCN